LASDGLHSNGFSLVRKIIFQDHPMDLQATLPELGRSLGEELLTPTRIYVKPLLSLIRKYAVKGMAHITGGGLTENLPRVLPKDCQARLVQNSWPAPPIFTLIQKWGKVSTEEMRQVFNNGLGMILIVPDDQTKSIMAHLEGQGEHCFLIGEVLPKSPGGEAITWI
jgi:phosphoribosylformylglycinamidine cyclo-ligase